MNLVDTENDMAQLAAEYVNTTNRHIFLTGKAGTGKTTFLQSLSSKTYKQFIVVAPTGIAALNAGGVTIHSQFLFPLGAFVPKSNGLDQSMLTKFYDAKQLTIRHPLNSVRKQVLRDIDLLIIDEVSMLRADVLDAIDFRLRQARGKLRLPFGGVQLLLIGDLFQLPPIIKPDEFAVLRDFYSSIYFFESLALKQDGYVYVELEKVYRQSDDAFIKVLNKLRNDECEKSDIDFLNSFYKADKDIPDGTITLTTHNREADQINQKSLDAIDEKSFTFKAEVKSDFPEKLYPLPEEMVFKKGAQVMFVKNDSKNKDFYNGKLAKIIEIGTKKIRVKMSGEDRELELEQMIWNNIKYGVDDNKELKEEIAGTFAQFPIKLAWAITVHKSQGLTFERAVIDVGRAFAPGQVYVALSRLRSLDGLILKTRINQSGISTDGRVTSFKSNQKQAHLDGELRENQLQYLSDLLLETFSFNSIFYQIEYVERKSGSKMEFEDEDLRSALLLIKKNIKSEENNTRKFSNQIRILIRDGEFEKLLERIEKGTLYYLNFAYDLLYQILLHKEEVSQFAKTKTYVNGLSEVDQLIMLSITKLQQCLGLSRRILNEDDAHEPEKDAKKRLAKREAYLQKIGAHIEANPRKGARKSGKRKKSKGPIVKGATFEETYKMLDEGLSIHQIAFKRSMADSTIEGHVARGIQEGKVKIEKLMGPDEIKEIAGFIVGSKESKLNEAYAHFKGKFSYGKLRMVQAALSLK